MTSYELGSKNFFLDKRLQMNIAAYYYDIENYLFNSAGFNLIGNAVSGGTNLPEGGNEFSITASSRSDIGGALHFLNKYFASRQTAGYL